jgi:hypothetical protein
MAQKQTYILAITEKINTIFSITHRKLTSGYEADVTVYECEDCDTCAHKAKCTKAKGNRKM